MIGPRNKRPTLQRCAALSAWSEPAPAKRPPGFGQSRNEVDPRWPLELKWILSIGHRL